MWVIQFRKGIWRLLMIRILWYIDQNYRLNSLKIDDFSLKRAKFHGSEEYHLTTIETLVVCCDKTNK